VWLGIVGPWVAEVEEARANAETGLVVDLRHNFDGDFTFVRNELADWTAVDVPVFRSRTRNGPDRGSFDAWTDWAIEGEGATSEVPVVVLTDRYTLSAGERATMMFRALPGVTVIGEPTNGSISTMIGQELANGWFVTIPVQEVEGPGGEVWEGVRIPPAIEVLEDLGTAEDDVLEAALALLE
jgi:carboxyl-terminal processing protease